MKKLIQKISFSSLMLITTMGTTFAAATAPTRTATGNMTQTLNTNMCKLISEMSGVFGTLRTLAFIGAAFIIAGWAWGYITKPGDLKIEDVKTKGIGMLVGFILLFSIGLIISVFMSRGGPCAAEISRFGM